MRAIVNPAVLGVPVSEGGRVRGRAKKTMGMFLVGYCVDVALIITSSRLRCVGGVFLCGCMLVLARAPGTVGGAVYAGGGAAGGGHYLSLSNSRQIRVDLNNYLYPPSRSRSAATQLPRLPPMRVVPEVQVRIGNWQRSERTRAASDE